MQFGGRTKLVTLVLVGAGIIASMAGICSAEVAANKTSVSATDANEAVLKDANSTTMEKATAFDVNSLNTAVFRPPADEKKARLWALACAGILMERNGSPHDVLETSPKTRSHIASTKKLLKDAWGIENRADLMDCLDSLERRGHRASFEADVKYVTGVRTGFLQKLRENSSKDWANQLKIVRQYYKQLGAKGILGWDISRYICLCKWGYTVGYLSEEEAWEKIMPAARLLQKNFVSWKELGENYIIGREYWGGGVNEQPLCEDALARLLESKRSPWVVLPWNTDLGEGPVMGEPRFKGGKTTGGGYANSITTEGNYRGEE